MEAQTVDWYSKRLQQLKAKRAVTEADVSEGLVRPALEQVMNFSIAEIDAQPSERRAAGSPLRPDFICRKNNSRRASLIVEVKNFKVDLSKRVGKGWTTAPLGQLHRYLNQLRESGDGTWGVVTNGDEWIVTRRQGDRVLPYERTPALVVQNLSDLQQALGQIDVKPISDKHQPLSEAKFDWLDAVADCQSPEEFIALVSPSSGDSVQIRGSTAYKFISQVSSGSEVIPESLHVACLQLNFPDGLLSPSDITEALIEIQSLAGSRVVGVAYTNTASDESRKCRGFISVGGRLYATALIDPRLPGSRAERQFSAISANWADASAQSIVNALSIVPLQSKFHEEIGQWFASTGNGRNELRHLIRMMFAWLLQERGVLPDNTLWDQIREPCDTYEVHNHVNWLFTELLATPKELRSDEVDGWKMSLVESVPFLNGSLFSALSESELPKPIKNASYLGEHGVFSILSRYDWTLHDRTGYASESALDPTLLGDMFEQLILQTDGPRLERTSGGYVHRKMPGGTYYTPQDAADEMVADAIAGWLSPKVRETEWEDMRQLVHPDPPREGWRQWSRDTRRKVSQFLSEVSVLDPCCGSGAFTLSVLHAIWRARCRLSSHEEEHPPLDDLERIIEKQLYAVDIHPMAVLITRLRLFIALIDVRSRFPSNNRQPPRPLPNLETRCITADTLCVPLAGQETIKSFTGGGGWTYR